jgi:hypothetical protein
MATTEQLLQKISLALSYIVQNMDNFSDYQALQIAELYAAWHIDVNYKVGQIVRHEEKLYRCVQAHTSQENWTPDVSASMWSEIKFAENGIEEWIQPTGSHNAYNVGDHVMHNGVEWVSLINGNVYEPSNAVPTLWEKQ